MGGGGVLGGRRSRARRHCVYRQENTNDNVSLLQSCQKVCLVPLVSVSLVARGCRSLERSVHGKGL